MADGPVLIVDDDPLTRAALAAALTGCGYPVQLASQGHEALAAVQRVRPAVLIVDLLMPTLDGRGLIRELATRSINVPLIIMSGHDDARQFARECGAVAFLEKPFGIPRLLAALAACQCRSTQSMDTHRAAS